MRSVIMSLLIVSGISYAAGDARPGNAVGGPYTIQRQLPLGGPGGWDYLAIDSAANRLFISRGDRVLVMSTLDGSLVKTIGDTQGVHGIARGLVFSSNGQDGTLTIIHEDDPDHYSVIDNVTTQKSARTMALDAKTHRVYLAAAQFAATPAPSVDQPHPRPSAIDGSFKVLVVGN